MLHSIICCGRTYEGRPSSGRKGDQVMKRIERVVVDECIGRTSALPGQLRSRLGNRPIKFIFLATEHPGIPDVEILDKLLDARTALLTQDRVLHNLAIGRVSGLSCIPRNPA